MEKNKRFYQFIVLFLKVYEEKYRLQIDVHATSLFEDNIIC